MTDRGAVSRAWTRRPARRVVGLLLATLVGGCGVRHAADGAASPSEVAALTEQPDQLDAGDHWLWATSGGSIRLKSCDGRTITAVEPVRR